MNDNEPLGKPCRRFEITDEYRELIEYVESLPENQSGADKTAVPEAMEQLRIQNLAKSDKYCRDVCRVSTRVTGPERLALDLILVIKSSDVATHLDALQQLLKKPDLG
jgi:hypothetical protein